MTQVIEKKAGGDSQKAIAEWFAKQDPAAWQRNAAIGTGLAGAGVGALAGMWGSDPGEGTRSRTKRILRDALIGGALGSGGGYLAYAGADSALKGMTGEGVLESASSLLTPGDPNKTPGTMAHSLPVRALLAISPQLASGLYRKGPAQAGVLNNLFGSPEAYKAITSGLGPFLSGRTPAFQPRLDGSFKVDAGRRSTNGMFMSNEDILAAFQKYIKGNLGDGFSNSEASSFFRNTRRDLFGGGGLNRDTVKRLVEHIRMQAGGDVRAGNARAIEFLRMLGVQPSKGKYVRTSRVMDILSRGLTPSAH
jgi:hypothetical protein